MAEFPANPITPGEFLEGWLPKAFAESELPPGAQEIDVKLGVLLAGDGGGEWVIHADKGNVSIVAGSREDTAFSIVQSVEDWQGALWGGRGGAFGQQTAAMFRPGSDPANPANRAASPAALAALQTLNGMIRMTVKGGEGGDWSVDFRLGPGAIPPEPSTMVTIAAEDAQAMADGGLDPMQAFMSGKIQIAGDMALMMQMQAIQMQAISSRVIGRQE